MLPIHKVLCPTDFSDSSRAAFQLACAVARDSRAALLVLHVAPPPRVFAADGLAIPFPGEDLYELRARLAHTHPAEPGVDPEYHVLDGDAQEQILKVAHDTGVDLIVLGTHGKSGLARLLTGSVAEGVMRHASCPVLTVRGKAQLAPVPNVPPVVAAAPA